MKRLLLLVLGITIAAEAVTFRPSSPTSAVDDLPDHINGWTPKPTKAARLRGFGAESQAHLVARSQSLDTCGFYSHDAENPFTCPAGQACGFFPSDYYPVPYFECCDAPGGQVNFSICSYYSTCLAYTQETGSISKPSGSVVAGVSGTILCNPDYPYCVTVSLTDSVGSPYTSFECGHTPEILYAYWQTTSGPVTKTLSITVTESQVIQTPSALSTTSSKGGNGGNKSPHSSAAGHGSGSQSSSSPHASGTHPSHPDTAAIAGGVVGGVAGIALIAGAIGYLVFRKKRQRVEPMREVSTYGSSY